MKVKIGNSPLQLRAGGSLANIDRGPRGYSAYEVAVQNGYTGTEEEWLASLQGAEGPAGPAGERGIQGPRGQQGDPGADGNGIIDITKTSTVGTVDTYTIRYTNGTTSTFEVHNGEDVAELFFVNINEEVTLADKTSTEIFEASQAGKYAVGVYYNNDTFNIVPFTVIDENNAQCQTLFNTSIVQISIDNTGAVTSNNIELAEESDIPTQTSQLINNSGFITNAVSDLANYYLKSETYTKDEVQQLIAQIPSLNVVVVQELPASGEALTIYLLPRNPGELNNIYDEYMWLSSGWEKIGSTDIDLTDYVKFTDYATGSKGGVIKKSSSYGTDVTGSGILTAEEKGYNAYQSASNYMFIGKGTLENVIAGKELINETTLEESQALQDEVIEENTKDIEYTQTLSNLFEKSTGTATELTLNNTEDTQLKIGLKGNTYQYSTEGKNLFNKNATPKQTNQVDVTPINTGIRLTQINTGSYKYAIFVLFDINNYIGQKFTLSGTAIPSGNNTARINIMLCDSDGENRTTLQTITGNNLNATATIPTPSGNSHYLGLTIYSTGDYTASSGDYIDYTNLQLETGSTATDFEPYTNGASPNPDYPQDIQVVTGDNSIKIENKNLLPNNLTTQTKSGVTATKNEDGTITLNGTSTGSDYFAWITKETPLTIGSGTYTGSWGKTGNFSVYFQTTNDTYPINTTASAITSKSFTLDQETTFKNIRLAFSSGVTFNNFKIYLQLEKGSNASEYVSHKEQVYPINLGNIELCKIGDYQDYIHKNNDKWYLHKEIGKVVLDGTEGKQFNNFSAGASNRAQFYSNNIYNSTNYNIQTAYCSYFIYNPTVYRDAMDEVGMVHSGRSIYFRFGSQSSINTQALANDWLSTYNTEVYYVLATPTETEITDTTLISQLDNLQYAMAYKEQTNINQVNDDMPFELDYETFKPIRDVNSYGGLMMPDTTNMTPIKTIEYDVASNAYFKIMSIPNNSSSYDDLKGSCLFRITTTGEGINHTVEGYLSLRQQTSLIPWLAFRNSPGNGLNAVGTIGIRYLRYIAPKALNNNGEWALEFACPNNTARHMKIEIFSTRDDFNWYNSLTSTTYNTTYETGASLTMSTTDSLTVVGNVSMTVQTATSANYITSYLSKFVSGTLPKAHSAISAQQFCFMNGGEFYPSSNKTTAIEPGFGIHLCSNNINANSAMTATALRQKYNNATLTNIPHATLTAGAPCWFRCTTDANGNIYSDNYVDTERRPGYTWYLVGMATSANAINTDTTQSKFYTLDANGKLTHIDGLEIA